ncbi:GNAT family N-acetyltransferase [Sphingomicrobium arenosum]|uniref:GNAT family N-acetyltransferase n=1 Tax=Sphingomicrobium arenosum TaxID=2233861 RepID=UPI00223FD918|nr:GNAT family N-acetyltransferase [Sphingomicrobium arenosum]
MAFRLETERLVMRDWRSEDCRDFYAVMNTPAVMRWIGGPQAYEDWEQAFERLQGYSRDFGHTFWLLERKADGKLLGFCGLKRLNYDGAPNLGMPEIGWRLRESAWGQGYAGEAARASLDLAFDRFGYSEVTAVTVSDNAPSWRLMERLGMRERPELAYHDGKYSDLYGPARQWVIEVKAWRTAGDTSQR